MHFILLVFTGCSGDFQEVIVSSTPTGAKVCLDDEGSEGCTAAPGAFRLRADRNHAFLAVYGAETLKTAVISHPLSSPLSRLSAASLADTETSRTISNSLTCPDYVLIPNTVHFDFETKTETDDASRHKHLGFHYFAKNDQVSARDHLSRSFELNPKQPDVAYVLGRLGVVLDIQQEDGRRPSED